MPDDNELLREISRLKREVVENRQKVAYLTNVINKLPVSVYWKDLNGRYLGCNKYVAEMAGVDSPELIIGKTDYDLPWKAHADFFKKIDSFVMNSARESVLEEPATLSNNKKITVLTTKTPLYDENNNIVGIIGTSMDITARKHAEEREKKALLEAAESKAKANLEENLRLAVTVVAGRIAHDIRTPLSILLGSSQNLENFLPKILEGYRLAKEQGLEVESINPGQYAYLQDLPSHIANEINRLNQFISSTLKMLSKVVINELNPEDLEVCWINGIIDRALKNYPYARERDRSLIDWKIGKDFTFLGNDILLIYAFYNLIKNAFQQIEKNKKGQIYITTEIGKQANLVYFKDTAGGASPALIKQFFSGYKTDKQEGTGIGLASVKQTMQLFGGDITCRSEEGDFIEFVFTFPALVSK